MESFKSEGNGIPILFISGLFAGDWIWGDVTSYFSKTQYTIIRLREPLSAYGHKISELREMLIQFLNESIKDKAIVIGNSLGGLLAMDLASSIPEKVAAIVVSGAPGMGSTNLGIGPPKMGSKEESKKWFGDLREKLFVNRQCVTDEQLDLVSEFFSDRRSFLNMIRLAKEADKYDAKSILPKIECPILLLWGDQDKVSPIEPWKSSIPLNPQIQLKVIENSGHSPMMEKPREFWESIESFIKSVLVHHT
ncbi:alpha/beta fold hydrolase [Anoxybacillus sp. MB8]|uniref:alpha/beta fold hydrolase n=1 Tax=Anoxybacillus sp. MB8 TaxID=2496850 RepID=UPI0013D6999F|nr:alpha/beta hydrolase [Anoxybacillus sp. MB8]